ncbi:NEDD8 protease Nep2 [Schizosaccharomyces japonicus yFS275]|uniref:NEDD8 protease Nep2 n=1 Tax=Schizosaccharomyces japonicus (strain yFS275 / FY16936) TaxID=402676 RepID=B6JWJ9_SCHJY|nr:NEDD8 protease Nep2 [Schizosaccharomyces japonicus yFS275]EEB05750.1 NEDD8 protease Nep2 [Schizosaccharomyces japonicus yFS275]
MRSNSIFSKDINEVSAIRSAVSDRSSSRCSETSQKKKKRGFFRSLFSSFKPSSTSTQYRNRIWLEFYEVCLRKDDVDHFRPGYWVLDTNIDFYFEILQYRVLLPRPASVRDEFLLMRPAMVYFLSQAPDPREIAGALPPELMKASYLFLPINDTSESGIEGGSHWSLLVVSVEQGVGYYYDSMTNGNANDCNLVVRNLSILLNKRFTIKQMKVPQQVNDCDCGLHVCENTRILLYRLLQKPYVSKVDMNLEGTQVDTVKLRKDLMRLITLLIMHYGTKIPKTQDFRPDPVKDAKIFSLLDRPEVMEVEALYTKNSSSTPTSSSAVHSGIATDVSVPAPVLQTSVH